VKLRAAFPNRDSALFPNQFVNTRLLVTTMENQIMVPSSAIQHNGDVAFVYLIEPGPGNPIGQAAPESGATARGTTAPAGGVGQAGSGEQSGGKKAAGGSPATPRAQYHVVQTNVKTGVTDNGMTAVQGIEVGNVVANSSFDKLINGAPVMLSKQGIPTTQTTISGESSAP
jgi:multidrug efflux system membrane fusion protein